VLDRQIEDGGGRLFRAPPATRAGLRIADRVGVALARRALGGRELHDLEPRMAVERREELLAGDAGGADDGDALARRHVTLLLVRENKKARDRWSRAASPHR